MANFNFTSNFSTCKITGLKDKSVTQVIIPDYVTSIGSSAFYNCNSLTKITVNEDNANFKDIDGNLYTKDGKTLLQYAIGKKDTSFTIPNGVETIGYSAFRSCESLTSVVIGDSVTSIGNNAFYNCDSLTSVEIGDSVTSIGDGAFYDCYKLVEVINKSSHITVTKGSTSNGYVGYYALSVSNRDNAYVSKLTNDNGYIIYTNGAEKILVGYSGTETALTLPSYITKIYQYAFHNCDSLASVVIGDSVTSIGDYAFAYCDSLTSVEIGDSVTSIGSSAFYGCSSLTSIKYRGTQSQWNAISKGGGWDFITGSYTITYNYVGE